MSNINSESSNFILKNLERFFTHHDSLLRSISSKIYEEVKEKVSDFSLDYVKFKPYPDDYEYISIPLKYKSSNLYIYVNYMTSPPKKAQFGLEVNVYNHTYNKIEWSDNKVSPTLAYFESIFYLAQAVVTNLGKKQKS